MEVLGYSNGAHAVPLLDQGPYLEMRSSFGFGITANKLIVQQKSPPEFSAAFALRRIENYSRVVFLSRSLGTPILMDPDGRCSLIPNPPMDTDGQREDNGRGVRESGAIIRARTWVDGRLAGGLQALLGASMAAYSGCGERDGGIGHGKRRSRTGLARRGRWVGWRVSGGRAPSGWE